ncbi:DUF192 domain-containing protein [Candidatus Micrarchaeota archaeon]|nr:DUF192 domain-containing protein [Candidatus Micrarchaeota archaeon]
MENSLIFRIYGNSPNTKILDLLFSFPKKGFWSIHSFFVFFEFDAIYLDENRKIVDIIRGIKPFTPNISNTSAAKYLLEIPDCEIRFKLNEVLSFKTGD